MMDRAEVRRPVWALAVALSVLVLAVGTCWGQQVAATEVTAAPTASVTPAEAAGAGVVRSPDGRVNNIFADEDIRQALRDIAAQTGAVIIPDQTVHGVVSCELRDVPLERALEMVLFSGGFVYKKVDGVYLVGSASPGSPSFTRLADVRRVTLRNTRAGEVYRVLNPTYQAYVQADELNNVLVVSAPEPILGRIIEHVSLLDQPSEQVTVEIMVVEINAAKARQMGVEWRWQSFGFNVGDPLASGTSGGYTGAGSMGLLGERNTMSWTEASVTDLANIKLLIEQNDAQVRANPRVCTLNGREAEIFVGREQYFTVFRGTGYYAYQQLEKVDAGITLRIKPFVGEDGVLTIDIDPEVSDVISVSENGSPVIATRRVHTSVRCREGHTIMLGGLTQIIQQIRESKVPVLGDIPIIGGLFREKHRNNTETELVIFLRPHVLTDGVEQVSTFQDQQWPTVELQSQSEGATTPAARQEGRGSGK